MKAYQQGRVATIVDWLFAPDWLTVDEACQLSGWNRGVMLSLIEDGNVDTIVADLIEKQSLCEFQETLVEILHRDD